MRRRNQMSNICNQIYKNRKKDRVCIISHPYKEFPRISHIIYENGFHWNVEKFNVRIMGKNFYADDFKLHRDCPPSPISLILEGLFVREKMFDHVVAFAYFCDRQAKKIDIESNHDSVGKHAGYAADYAADVVNIMYIDVAVRTACNAASQAADAASWSNHIFYREARKEQYEFLVYLLKGTKWEIQHELRMKLKSTV